MTTPTLMATPSMRVQPLESSSRNSIYRSHSGTTAFSRLCCSVIRHGRSCSSADIAAVSRLEMLLFTTPFSVTTGRYRSFLRLARDWPVSG